MAKLDTTVSPAADAAPGSVPTGQAASGPFISRLTLWVAALFLVVAVGGLAVWWMAPRELHGVLLQSPRVADDFTLMASTDQPLKLSDLRGKFVLLYFGYTFCPDVCPTTLNDLKGMAQTLGPDKMERIQVVLVSVDPERDTPTQLAIYLKYFDPSFLGLTGSVAEVQAVASQFGVYFERHEGSAATGYLVDHTSAITVIDPQGYVRMVFPHGTTAADLAADMAYLLRRG
jgi:protein SCO1/2